MVRSLDIEFIGHATVLFRLGSLTLLFDPHLGDNFRFGYFSYFPGRKVDTNKIPALDAIIISHSHRDHFDVASLALLDRKTPVFCPNDFRLDYTLNRLGFREVYTVADWTKISPTSEIDLLWTPSRYRVPENGIAIRYQDQFIWNTVDSVLHDQPDWIKTTCDSLGCERFDVLMKTCQVLMETHVSQGRPAAYPVSDLNNLRSVLAGAPHRYLIPFADGHYCCGPCEWLNHHKFALSRPTSERLIREVSDAVIVWPEPGGRLSLIGDEYKFQPAKSEFVTVTGANEDRLFHPAGRVDGLVSTEDEVHVDFNNFAEGRRSSLSGEIRSVILARSNLLTGLFSNDPHRQFVLFKNYYYEFSLIDAEGARVDTITVEFASDGTISEVATSTEPTPQANIEVCLARDDFHCLLNGTLGYSAALLGARIREYRKNVTPEEASMLVDASSDGFPARCLFTGLLVCNLLFNHFRNNMAVVDIDFELAVTEGRQAPLDTRRNPFPPRMRNTSIFVKDSSRILLAAWNNIFNCLRSGKDPGLASGFYSDGERKVWISIFGRDASLSGASSADDVWLIPFNFVEYQPLCGTGISYPQESFARIVSELLAAGSNSGPLKIVWSTPYDLRIPRWRLPNLLPLRSRELLRALREGMWNGSLLEIDKPDCPDDVEWWYGIPPIAELCEFKRVMIPLNGSEILGDVRVAATSKYALVPSGTFSGQSQPCFRLDLDLQGLNLEEDIFPAVLLEGRFRFSWVYPSDETDAAFGGAISRTGLQFVEQVSYQIVDIVLRSVQAIQVTPGSSTLDQKQVLGI